jgi:hypothetical protein
MKFTGLCLVGILAILLASAHDDHANAQQPRQNFVPGELIVGYASTEDRETALKDLDAARSRLTVKGRPLDSLHAATLGSRVVKLHVEAASEADGPAKSAPVADLSSLQELAAQIKRLDKSVKYAHPNWVATIAPSSQGSADAETPQ